MKRIIQVGDFEIVKDSCSVGFNISSDVGRSEITHAGAYRLLDHDATTDVKRVNDYMISFTHGLIKFKLYKKGDN